MVANVEIVRSLYAAFERGDVAAVLAAMDPQVDWNEAERFPYGGRYVGPPAVLQGVFARLASDWEGYRADPDEFFDAGETVVVLGHYTGRHRATGKSFRAPFSHGFRLSGGRIAHFRQYTDTAIILDAMK